MVELKSENRPAAGDTNRDNRSFGWVFAGVFALLGLLPLVHGAGLRWWALASAGVLIPITLAAPQLLATPRRRWLRFGELLHRVTNPLILGLLFYGVMTPMGWLMRLAGRDCLRLRRGMVRSTYWVSRDPPGPVPDSMKHQF